jgi:hypothetical protein
MGWTLPPNPAFLPYQIRRALSSFKKFRHSSFLISIGYSHSFFGWMVGVDYE